MLTTYKIFYFMHLNNSLKLYKNNIQTKLKIKNMAHNNKSLVMTW